MFKYIGNDGLVHTLGDDYLMHFNHNHDSLGRFSSSNHAAGAVASRYERINKRQAKINKLNTKINSDRNQKRMVRAAKYQRKLDKATVKARRAHKKQLKGKELSKRDVKKLNRENKYRAKAAGYSRKNDVWEAKLSKLERRNYKDAKKINRMVDKYGDTAMRDVKASDKTAAVRMYLEQAAHPENKRR